MEALTSNICFLLSQFFLKLKISSHYKQNGKNNFTTFYSLYFCTKLLTCQIIFIKKTRLKLVQVKSAVRETEAKLFRLYFSDAGIIGE